MIEALEQDAGEAAGSAEAAPLVLVVDDAAFDRRLVVALLGKHGQMRTQTAADGREALRMMARELPAVVLTDLQMPEMDGLELVEQVRQRHSQTPVVLMTANGSEDAAIQALQAGAASYVPKRSLDRELAATLERVLGASRASRRRERVLECVQDLDCRMVLDNDVSLVPALVQHFQEYLLRMGVCEENSKIRAGVALEEALLNAIYHGNLELSSDLRQDGGDAFTRLGQQRRRAAPYALRRVHLHARLTAAEATFVLRDEGPGFDVSSLPDPTDPMNMLRVGGRGLLLIRTFMDEVRHNDRGNEITLVRRRKRT
jgi:CheY-like chemotaxis protein/anti-sigma regulatory factor (Ser/Thr protein kinase)